MTFRPSSVHHRPARALDSVLLSGLRHCSGITATASDILDELGLRSAVSATAIRFRAGPQETAVGQALTVRYVPCAYAAAPMAATGASSMLAHDAIFELGRPGDVLVMDGSCDQDASCLGSIAAMRAKERGIGACIVDGAIRDVSDIAEYGVPVWSRTVTPLTGRWRLEAAEINGIVSCAGIRVMPGDLVLADTTGVCVVPLAVAEEVARRTLDVISAESEQLTGQRTGDSAGAGTAT